MGHNRSTMTSNIPESEACDCPLCQSDGLSALELRRRDDGQWHATVRLPETDESEPPDVEGIGPTAASAMSLALRGAGMDPKDAIAAAAALILPLQMAGHPDFAEPEPVKPFPWLLLCVYAPLLAVAVVAGVWLILKYL